MDNTSTANRQNIWSAQNQTGDKAKYVYIIGGYYLPDNGGTWPWGDTAYSKVRFIGNKMADIQLEYSDGTIDNVPLIYGYTLWWYDNWKVAPRPFKGEGSDPELSELLQKTLFLYGAWDANEHCALRIKTDSSKELKSVYLIHNSQKEGYAVIDGVHVFADTPDKDCILSGTVGDKTYSVKATDQFYDTHTILSSNPITDKIINDLDRLCLATATCEKDWLNAPEYTYSDTYKGPQIYFTGTPYANIANGVIDFSLTDLATRADDRGFLGESLSYTEQYFYGGIGTYTMGGAYGHRMYSRNKTMLVLNAYGLIDRAELSVNFENRSMMFYPENNLTVFGIPIPGHLAMDVADPRSYKKDNFHLTKYNNPQVYGDENWNLANAEQDGHGMMMLSNWNVWKSRGGTKEWVDNNWKYINEAAEWILWCFEHEDITYCTNNVLYAESEGVVGWMGYSLYCNEPCYLGLLAYIEMAEAVGKYDVAARWKACAERFDKGILDFFTNSDGTWNFEYEGKDRDPALGFMRYLYGYDTADMHQPWVERTMKSYDADLGEMIAKDDGYWGPWGTGYDHATILQNAMMLDKMQDVTILMNNLSKICYSPYAPDKYGVPEAFAVDTCREYIRRVGDFENQIHTSEVLSVYLLSMGISPVLGDKTQLKIIPRLAENWNVSVKKFKVEHTDAVVDFTISYPESGVQKANIHFDNIDTIRQVKMRFGPFASDISEAVVMVNGAKAENTIELSGDSKWVWTTFAPREKIEYNFVITYN